MKHTLLGLLILTLGIGKTHAQCSMMEVPLTDRIKSSELIVEGKVTAQYAAWDKEKTMIFTHHTIEIYKVLKGISTSANLELVTPGGEVDGTVVVVQPSMQLDLNDAGIFTCVHSSITGMLGKYEAFAGPQGFIRYHAEDQSATDVFRTYSNVKQELYNTILTSTGSPFSTVKAGDLLTKPNATRVLDVYGAINFSPSTLSAGTNSVLTITGSGFTSNTRVLFKNADAIGGADVTPLPSQYVSVSSTQIKVVVPYFWTNTTTVGAGTGTISVWDGTNTSTKVTSASTLTIPYALFNKGVGGISYPGRLYNQDGCGGYTWNLSTNFTGVAGSEAAFIYAAKQWTCSSGMNWKKGPYTPATSPNPTNGLNTVTYGSLPAGVLAYTIQTFLTCTSGGTTTYYLNDVDININAVPYPGYTWNYNLSPGTTASNQADFVTNILHELGHAHLLGHVLNTTDPIYPSESSADERRHLITGDQSGSSAEQVQGTQPICIPAGPLTPVELQITPPAVNNCSQVTTVLNACGSDNYTWSNGGGTSSSASFTPASTTTYTVTATPAYACGTVHNTVTVNVGGSTVVPKVTSTGSVICPSYPTVTLGVNPATSYTGVGYQWQSITCGGTWADLTGATASTYTVTSADGDVGTWFRLGIKCGSSITYSTMTPRVYQVSGCTQGEGFCGGPGSRLINPSPVKEDSHTTVYPNPSNGSFMVDTYASENTDVFITVTDIMGKELITRPFPATSGPILTNIDLSGYPKGIYLIRVTNGPEVKMIKEILQ